MSMKDQTNPSGPPPTALSGSAMQRLTASVVTPKAPSSTQRSQPRRSLSATLSRAVLPAALLPTLLPALLSCNADGTTPTLLDSEGRVVENTEPVSDELARLRKLQEVTWTVDDGTGPVTNEGPAANLVGSLAVTCSPYSEGTLSADHPCYIGSNGFNVGSGCGAIACANTYTYICTAHRALQVADSLTDTGYAYSDPSHPNITITVPPQSAGARVDLRKQAAKEAKRALVAALGQLASAQDSPLCAASAADVSDVRNSMESSHNGLIAGQMIAQQAIEALNLYREAAKSAAYEVVNYAETFRAHPTQSEAVRNSMAGEELSRAEAIHLLLGGSAGLDGHPGMCTYPNLTPTQQAVTEVLIDEGICPDDFKGEISLERIEQIVQASANKGVLASQLDAVTAAQALSQQATALGASSTASYTDAAGNVVFTGLKQPNDIDAMYYAAIGRYYGAGAEVPRSDTGINAMPTLYDLQTATNYADVLDIAGQFLATLVARTWPPSLKSSVEAPLAMELAAVDAERLGRMKLCTTPSSFPGQVVVWGYSTADHLLVVNGEDGLKCAVNGNIDGTSCDLFDANNHQTTLVFSVLNSNYGATGSGFETAVSGYVPAFEGFEPEGKRAYLVRPKDGLEQAPGNYEALAAGTFFTEYGCDVVPIVPELNRQAGEWLRPNKDWCTLPAEECDGTFFDDKIPLEDELTDDGDGVENSWKHYLALAKQAADEADLLGQQMVGEGLDVDRRAEELELRKRGQDVEAIRELEELQTICGTDIDPYALLNHVSTDCDFSSTLGGFCSADADCGSGSSCIRGRCMAATDWQSFLDNCERVPNNGSACTSDAQCDVDETCIKGTTAGVCVDDEVLDAAFNSGNLSNMVGDSCDDNNPCGGYPYICRAGKCTQYPGRVVTLNSDEPAIARLEACLGAGTDNAIVKAVTPGTTPLCYWTRPHHPNEVCWTPEPQGGSAASPPPDCPFEAEVDPAHPSASDPNHYKCDASPVVDPETQLPLAVMMTDAQLGYFDPKGGGYGNASDAADACATLREWRATPTLALLQTLIDSNVYHPTRLEAIAADISWRAKLDSHSAVLLRGAEWPKFDTGNLWTGVRDDLGTVCGAADCLGGPIVPLEDGLMCDNHLCGDPQSRAVLNTRLKHAVVALKAILAQGTTEGTLIDPAKYAEQLKIESFRGPLVYPEKYVVPTVTGLLEIPGISIPIETYSFEDGTPGTGYYFGSQSLPFVPWIGIDLGDSVSILGIGDSRDGKLVGSAIRPRPLEFENIGGLWRGLSQPSNGYCGTDTCPIVEFMASRSSPAEAALLSTRPRGGNRYETENGQFRFDLPSLSAQSVLDAMELVCEAIQEGARPGGVIEQLTLPEVNSIRDLEGVRGYVSYLSSSIERAGSHLILFHFPEAAVDALRHESALGAFPRTGGQYGEAIGRLRAALIRLHDVSPQLAAQTRQLNYDIAAVQLKLENIAAKGELDELQFQSVFQSQLTDCAVAGMQISNSSPWGIGGAAAAASATCTNAAFQTVIAKDMLSLQEGIEGRDTELTLTEFRAQFDTRAEAMRELSAALVQAAEEIDAQLAAIENMRLSARRSLTRALQASSYQATSARYVNNALHSRFTTTKERYKRALQYAKKMSILARRSIETRLGMHFADMKEDLPLVEAPYSWAWDVCNAQGIDYNEIRDSGDPVNYADKFIGDYVRKLEAVVESYRLKYNFHEGSDTAVVSLRDDILRVTDDEACLVETANLLYHSADFRVSSTAEVPGWDISGCGNDENDEPTLCISSFSAESQPLNPGDSSRDSVSGFRVNFGNQIPPSATCDGCGLTTNSRLAQTIALQPGTYQLSWHARPVDGLGANPTGEESVQVLDAQGTAVAITLGTAQEYVSGWTRYNGTFVVPDTSPINTTEYTVAIVPSANGNNPAVPHQVDLAAISLTFAPIALGEIQPPIPYELTTNERVKRVSACQDTDGDKFRLDRWTYRCLNLCNNGFSGECPQTDAKEYCFMETSFNLNQKQIELGNQLTQSGFARGNFNYRIEDIAVNFVGTDLRSCESSDLPQTCFSAGFIPYSLIHGGKYTVRNHAGESFDAKLYEGNIEHARGLATERYLSNPLSDADSSLLSQYMRSEFKGRPLDGEFTIRVWEDDQFSFEKIQDVQLVLKYRYWTRFN